MQGKTNHLPADLFVARHQNGSGAVPNNLVNLTQDMLPRQYALNNLYMDAQVPMLTTGVQVSRTPQQLPSGVGRGLRPEQAKAGDRLDMTTQIAMSGTGQSPMGSGKKPVDEHIADHRRRRPGMDMSFAGINRGRWSQSA